MIPTVDDEISTDGVGDYITEIESTYLKYANDNNIGGVILEHYFVEKPKFIGVLEIIYKGHPGSRDLLNKCSPRFGTKVERRKSLLTYY